MLEPENSAVELGYASRLDSVCLHLQRHAQRTIISLWTAIGLQLVHGILLVAAASIRDMPSVDHVEIISFGFFAGAPSLIIAPCVFISYLVTLVLFCIWIHDALTAVRLLNRFDMEYSPGWAIAWIFIPIANLVKPYFIMKELSQAAGVASATPDRWREFPVPHSVHVWWSCLIVGGIIKRLSSQWPRSGPDGDMFDLQGITFLVGVALVAIAGVCCIHIVGVVTYGICRHYIDLPKFTKDKQPQQTE